MSHKTPTEDEDNKLFLSTGFRYTPAIERGFPYPWCAKKSKKGWVIRDRPPPHHTTTSKQPDNGVVISGWRMADKLFRTHKVLLQRVQNNKTKGQTNNEHASSSTNVCKDDSICKDDSGPIKKRKLSSSGEVSLNKTKERDVDNWLRDTNQAIKTQRAKAKEEQFQAFLQKKRKQYALEIKEKLRKKMQVEKQKRKDEKEAAAKLKCKSVESPARKPSAIATTSTPPMSPMRRKHKKLTPVKRTQLSDNPNSNSIILGEDPALDDMVESIVLEFTRDFDPSIGLEFDGGAVDALMEAARDELVHEGRQESNHINGAKMSEQAKQPPATINGGGDERITEMIQQLVSGAGCEFDGSAVSALKEALTEIMHE